MKILGKEISNDNLLSAAVGLGLGAAVASVIYKQDTIKETLQKVRGQRVDIFQAERVAREYLNQRQVEDTTLISCNFDGHDWIVSLQSEDKNFVYVVKVDPRQGQVSGWTVNPKS